MLIDNAKNLSLVEKREVKRRILNMFYYTKNPLLDDLSKRESDFLTFAFSTYALKCDGFTMIDMILNYSLGIPSYQQGGYYDSDSDGRFFSEDAHAWVVTQDGIEESTGLAGQVSPLYGRKATEAEWQDELDYIQKRASLISRRNETVILGKKGKAIFNELSGKVMQGYANQRRVVYSQFQTQYEQRLDDLDIQDMGIEKAQSLIKSCVDDTLFTQSDTEDQFMGSSEFALMILSEIEKNFPELHKQVVLAKRIVFEKIVAVSQDKQWELEEPIRVGNELIFPDKDGESVSSIVVETDEDQKKKYVVDIGTGERYEIPYDTYRVHDYYQGLIVTEDFESNYFLLDSHVETIYGPHFGTKNLFVTAYGPFLWAKILYSSSFSGEWVARIKKSPDTFEYIGPLAENADICGEEFAYHEDSQFGTDGIWIEEVIDKNRKKTLVGTAYHFRNWVSDELNILYVESKDRWLAIQRFGNSYMYIGSPQHEVEQVHSKYTLLDNLDNIFNIDWIKNPSQDEWIASITTSDNRSILIGPGSEKFKTDTLPPIRKFYYPNLAKDGLLMAEFEDGTLRFIGPKAFEIMVKGRPLYDLIFYAHFSHRYVGGINSVLLKTSSFEWAVIDLTGNDDHVFGITFSPTSFGRTFSDGSWCMFVYSRPNTNIALLLYHKRGSKNYQILFSIPTIELEGLTYLYLYGVSADGSWVRVVEDETTGMKKLDGPIAEEEKESSELFNDILYAGVSEDGRLLAVVSDDDEYDEDGYRNLRFIGSLAENAEIPPEGIRASMAVTGIEMIPTGEWIAHIQHNGVYKFVGPLAQMLGIDKLIFPKWQKFNFTIDENGNGVLMLGKSWQYYTSFYPVYKQDYLSRLAGKHNITHPDHTIPDYHFKARFRQVDKLAEIGEKDAAREELETLLLDVKEEGLNKPQLDPQEAIDILARNAELCEELSDPATAELFELLFGTHLKHLIIDILVKKDKDAQKSIIDLLPFSPFEWRKIIYDYISYQRAIYSIEEEQTPYVIPFVFPKRAEDESDFRMNTFTGPAKEAVNSLNKVLLENLEGKYLLCTLKIHRCVSIVENFSLIGTHELDTSDYYLDYALVKGPLKLLKQAVGMPDTLFDVEVSNWDTYGKLYQIIQFIRMNYAFGKLDWSSAPWEISRVEMQRNWERWQKLNEELHGVFEKEKVITWERKVRYDTVLSGRQHVDFWELWSGFWSEVSHDSFALASLIGFLYLILSYAASERLRKKDKIIGQSGHRIMDNIWDNNLWFKGRNAERAQKFLHKLIRRQHYTDKLLRQMEQFRSLLTSEEQAVFDLIRCIPEPPGQGYYKVRKGLFIRRILGIIPFLVLLSVKDTKAHKQRQAFIKELEELVSSIETQNLSVDEFYSRLLEILKKYQTQKYSYPEDVKVQSRQTFEQIRKEIISRIGKRKKVYVSPTKTYAVGPNGKPTRRSKGIGDFMNLRPYSQGDDARMIDWKASARLGTIVVKELELERENPVHLLIDFRSVFKENNKDIWINELANSLISLFLPKKVEGEKHFTLKGILFVMPDGQLIDTIDKVSDHSRLDLDRVFDLIGEMYEEARKKAPTYDGTYRRFLGFQYGRERVQFIKRTEGIFDINGVIKGMPEGSIRKIERDLSGQTMLCAGVTNWRRRQISEGLENLNIRSLFWNGNFAVPLSRIHSIDPSRYPVSAFKSQSGFTWSKWSFGGVFGLSIISLGVFWLIGGTFIWISLSVLGIGSLAMIKYGLMGVITYWKMKRAGLNHQQAMDEAIALSHIDYELFKKLLSKNADVDTLQRFLIEQGIIPESADAFIELSHSPNILHRLVYRWIITHETIERYFNNNHIMGMIGIFPVFGLLLRVPLALSSGVQKILDDQLNMSINYETVPVALPINIPVRRNSINPMSIRSVKGSL